MFTWPRIRFWLFFLIGAAALTAVAVALVNPQLTRYVESREFREELDKQTSKGLHFEGRYKAIRRRAF